MIRRPFVLAVIAAMILPAVASLRANEERLKNSAVVLEAKCVAIIPGVKKPRSA